MTEGALRQLAWDACGIVRDAAGLQGAMQVLGADAGKEHTGAALTAYDGRSIHAVVSLIARCALAREESRGGHFRSDFPVSREEFRRPSVVRLDG
jgi:L-aspartate oxidase